MLRRLLLQPRPLGRPLSTTSQLLESLSASEATSVAEARALRTLWQHLQQPPAEPPCSDCDCGEPCGDPLVDWAAQDAAGRLAVLAASAQHSQAYEAAPPPRDASDLWAELPFASAAPLLLRCAQHYHRGRGRDSLRFADLGSGVGRPAAAAALLGYAAARGWEEDGELSIHAAAAVARLREMAVAQPPSLLRGEAGAAAAEWTSSDVVLAHGAAGSRLLAAASAHAGGLAPGALVVTVGAPLPAGGPAALVFQLTEKRRLPLGWGMGTLFIHRRLAGVAGEGGWEDAEGAELRRAVTSRLAPALRSPAAADAAAALAFACRHELCARAAALGCDALPALASQLRSDGPLAARAAAALALGQICTHATALWRPLTEHALPVLVEELRGRPLAGAAASAIADLAQGGAGAVGAVRAAGAEAPLRRLAAAEGGGSAAAAAATALEALGEQLDETE